MPALETAESAPGGAEAILTTELLEVIFSKILDPGNPANKAGAPYFASAFILVSAVFVRGLSCMSLSHVLFIPRTGQASKITAQDCSVVSVCPNSA